MKKGVAVAFVCLSIFLLVSMPIVSAGWFDNLIDGIKDFFSRERMTGHVIVSSCGGTNTYECWKEESQAECNQLVECEYYVGAQMCDNVFCLTYTDENTCVSVAGCSWTGTDICSDIGNDLLIKEKCTNPISAGGGISWDSCDGVKVIQYECDEDDLCGRANEGNAESCGSGYECSDGACVEIQEEVLICSDQGNILTVKEKCTNPISAGGGILWDSCEGVKVIQYECDMDGLCGRANEGNAESCGSGYECSDGACVVAGTCGGTATACSDITTLNVCGQIADVAQYGCSWIYGANICTGTATACSDITTLNVCGQIADVAQYGCSWTETSTCGDGDVDGSNGEECDGTNLNGVTCISSEFDGGTLTCDDATCYFDFSGCYNDVISNPGSPGSSPGSSSYSSINIIIYSPKMGIEYGKTQIPLEVGDTKRNAGYWTYSLNNGPKTIFTPNSTISAKPGSNILKIYAKEKSTASYEAIKIITFLLVDNPEGYCGDYICDEGEDCDSCETDCGLCSVVSNTLFGDAFSDTNSKLKTIIFIVIILVVIGIVAYFIYKKKKQSSIGFS